MLNKTLAVLLIFSLAFSAPLSKLSAAGNATENTGRSFPETAARFGLAFVMTSFIKGLVGMAPGYLATLVPAFSPAMAVPILVGTGILEGAISLTVFSLIMGEQKRRYLVRSFLLASIMAGATSFLLGGLIAPWAVTIASNAVRLALFAILTKPPEKEMFEHLVEEVTSLGHMAGEGKSKVNTAFNLSAAELEQLRRMAYKDYFSALEQETRKEAYERFKRYTEALLALKKEADEQTAP